MYNIKINGDVMKNFINSPYEDGQEVVIALASNFRKSFIGIVNATNGKFNGTAYDEYVYDKQKNDSSTVTHFITEEEIYAIAPATDYYKAEFDHILMHDHILKLAQEYELEKTGSYELHDIKTDIIMHTSYQRFLFEEKYYDKSHLDHVVFFSPSACYYANGSYNLNDKPITDESDAIAEIVDNGWQAWRNALLHNKWLNNIKPIEVTYKGL